PPADPARGRAAGRRGRDRRRRRRERRGQDDHAEGDRRPAGTDQRHHHLRRRARHRRAAQRAGAPRPRARPGGPGALRSAHRGGEPADGRLDAGETAPRGGSRAGLLAVPVPRRAPQATGGDPERRPAADARDRARDDGPPPAADARRAVHRALAQAHLGGAGGGAADPRARRRRAAGRAERRARARHRRPRLRPGKRQHRAHRAGPRAGARRPGARRLPGAVTVMAGQDAARKAMLLLGEWAARLRWEDVPPRVRDRLSLVLLDTLGVCLAGAREPEQQRLVEAWRPAAGPAPLLGAGRTAAVEASAWLNATALVRLELDEGNKYAKGHPAAHAFPAVIALAADLRAPGPETMTALLAAYEVASRFG